jgi:predicted RNA-binding protein
MQRNYWLDLFTGTTWSEFLEAGGTGSGFRESRWKTVQKMKPGDYLLCYLTGVSRFIGILEVVSDAYQDGSPIWKDEVFPCRLRVKPLVTVKPEHGVPIHDLRDHLSIFENLKSPHAWTGRLRGSPVKWKSQDGEEILRALRDAEENPVFRAVDPKKLARRPRALRAKIGAVTVPEDDEEDVETPDPVSPADPSVHTEIQCQLLRLGGQMGFSIWVARNDRIFPSPTDPRTPISRHLADRWLREGETLAGLDPQEGSLFHAYRRKWATERKHLPDVDVAAAGGWKNTVCLKTAYQQSDPETILKVVLEAGELREAKG